MDILGKWGAYLLVLQVVFGGVTYLWVPYITFSLASAGAVTVVFILYYVLKGKVIAAVLGVSSFAAVCAALFVLNFSGAAANLVTAIFVFFSIVASIIAAMILRYVEGAAEDAISSELVVSALPAIGAIQYLNKIAWKRWIEE